MFLTVTEWTGSLISIALLGTALMMGYAGAF
jgi:hypothetical protein